MRVERGRLLGMMSCCLAACAAVSGVPAHATAVTTVALLAAAQPPTEEAAVTLFLRPAVTIAAGPVLVGDVAALEGGSSELRQKIARLDLEELKPGAPVVEISSTQIAYRLQLAGLEVRAFRMKGAARVRVQLSQRPDPDIVPASRQEIREIPAGKRPAASEPPAKDTPLLKNLDLVRLIVRVGPVRVIVVGEALQDGRAGQLIRVRNVDSRNVVVGRVVDRATVEVEHGGTQP